jgi:putative addiction module component (TIGR02574 family)
VGDAVDLARGVRCDYNGPMERSFDQMTKAERILYVQDLWDRIAEEPEDVPVSDEMKAELNRRLAAHEADPSTAIPWEQVKAELRRRR